MIPLFGAVFVASLLGSGHCAGMCGGFLAFAVGAEERIDRRTLHAAYNGGRLITYLTLGLAAGAIGSAADLGGSLAGVQNAAAIIAGGLMIIFGLGAVLRACGARVGRVALPKWWEGLALRAHRAALRLPPRRRALAIGLLTTLLPCGWLYAFVVVAAGTASPVLGAAAMLAFWGGTLPMMVGLGVAVQQLSGALRKRLPLLTAVLLLVVGVATLTGRFNIGAMDAAPASGGAHGIEHVRQLESSEAPCCNGD